MNSSAYPKIRLYVHSSLNDGAILLLEDKRAHYVQHVMRMREGEFVAVFNGMDGDWCARIAMITKKTVTLQVERLLRKQRSVPDIKLLFAPIKGSHLDFIVEKATEMGVAEMQPVRTERTVVSRINRERMLAQAIEAAEQTERQDIPVIQEFNSLEKVLVAWDSQRMLFYGDETGGGKTLDFSDVTLEEGSSVAYLVGPEGGFSPKELQLLRQFSWAKSLSLGPRVLRADTAVVAGLTLLQMKVGDWHLPPRFCLAD